MTSFHKLIAGLTAALMVLGLPAAAFAQKMVYYDHAKVVRDSTAWKSVEAELNKRGAELAAQLQPLAQEVNAEEQSLVELTKDMSPEDAEKKHGKRIGEYRQKRAQLQVAEQQLNQQFGIIQELATAKINASLRTVLADVAKRRRVDMVLRKEPLSHYNQKFDVTTNVLQGLNAKLASLSVDQLIQEVQARQAAAQAAATTQ